MGGHAVVKRSNQELALAAVAARKGDRAAQRRHLLESKAYRLQEYVEKVLTSSPPLTEEQRERVAALLRQRGDAR